MLFTNNYSQNKVNEIQKNLEFLGNSTSVSTRALNIVYDLKVSGNWLKFQAETFANNYLTHGYINHYKVLRVKPQDVFNTYFEMYVYSFVKCLYNGLYFSNISEKANLGYCFAGHAALFNILKSPYNSGMKDDMLLSFNINLGTINFKRALILQLLKQFNFLSRFRIYSNDTFGTSPFIIPEFEDKFNCLRDDFYARDHVQKGAKNDSQDQDSTTGRSRGLSYDNGKIIIYRLDGNEADSILKFNETPIMNSFVGDNSQFYYIPVGNGKSVEFNPSFIFTKSNFINLSNNGNNMRRINNIYHTYTLTSSQDHLVCSEVFTNTGIKCRFYGKRKDDKLSLPSIDRIVGWLNKLGYVTEQFEELLDKIIALDEENDLVEFFNELIKQSAK